MRTMALLALCVLAGCASTGYDHAADGTLLLTLTPTRLEGGEQILMETRIVKPGDAELPAALTAPAAARGEVGAEVTLIDGPDEIAPLLGSASVEVLAMPSVVSRMGELATLTVGQTDRWGIPENAEARLVDGYALNVNTRDASDSGLELTVSFTECVGGNVVTDVQPVTVRVPVGSSVLVRAPRRQR